MLRLLKDVPFFSEHEFRRLEHVLQLSELILRVSEDVLQLPELILYLSELVLWLSEDVLQLPELILQLSEDAFRRAKNDRWNRFVVPLNKPPSLPPPPLGASEGRRRSGL